MSENRRDFIKDAIVGTGGAALAGAAAPAFAQAQKLNPAATAVMPDGSQKDRKAILSQLGLDPNTSPEAWLTIVACGKNASALRQDQLRSVIQKGAIKKEQLDKISQEKLR